MLSSWFMWSNKFKCVIQWFEIWIAFIPLFNNSCGKTNKGFWSTFYHLGHYLKCGCLRKLGGINNFLHLFCFRNGGCAKNILDCHQTGRCNLCIWSKIQRMFLGILSGWRYPKFQGNTINLTLSSILLFYVGLLVLNISNVLCILFMLRIENACCQVR